MTVKRDWFFSVTILLFESILFAGLAFSFRHIGAEKAYPDLLRGTWLLAAMGMIGLLFLFSCLWARLEIGKRLRNRPVICRVLEAMAGCALIIVGIMLRFSCISDSIVTPSGDFDTFFQIARLMSLGQLNVLSPFYSDYVSLFPDMMGYSKVLSWVFSVADVSVQAALYLNLALQGAALLLLWRAARGLAGRLGGMAALASGVFFPSMILYSGFVTRDFYISALLLMAIWLLIRQERQPLNTAHSFRHVFILLGAGVLLGVAANAYTLLLMLLPCLAIYYRRCSRKLPALLKNDLPLGHRAVSKGWKCFLLLFTAFFAVFSLSRFNTSYEVDRPLVGPFASLGYSVMQGLNMESEGAWNQEDAAFLMEKLEETGSPVETQMRCLDIAGLRLQAPLEALANLSIRKLDHLLGHDEFPVSMRIAQMENDAQMDEAAYSAYYKWMDICNFYYMLMLLLAGIGGLMTYFRRQSFSYALILFFDVIVLSYLALECQNRYHALLLPLLSVLSGIAVRETIGLCTERIMKTKLEKQRAQAEEEARKQMIKEKERQEKEIIALRMKALSAQFDMDKAIREGHIRVVVGQIGSGEQPDVANPQLPEGEKTTDE